MKRFLPAVVALGLVALIAVTEWAHTARAQAIVPPVQFPQTSTTAALTLYVNLDGGNDGYTCTAAGAPCLTVQGAYNKIPPTVANPVEISVAPGTYAGAWVEGFNFNRTKTPTSGAWIRLNGTMSDAGYYTASGGTKGAWSDETVNTVSQADAGWTVNAYQGDMVKFLSGHNVGSMYPVISNTATALSYGDNPGQTTSSGDGYQILSFGTKVDSSGPVWGTPSGFFSSAEVGGQSFAIFNTGLQAENVSFRYLKFGTSSATEMFQINGPASLSFQNCYFDGSGTFFGNQLSGDVTMLLLDNYNYTSATLWFGFEDNSATDFSMLNARPISVTSQGNVYTGSTGYAFGMDRASISSNYDYLSSILYGFFLGTGKLQSTHDIFKGVANPIDYPGAYGSTRLGGAGSAYVDSDYFDTVSGCAVLLTGGAQAKIDHANGTSVTNCVCSEQDSLAQITANTSCGTTSGHDVVLDTANFSFTTLRGASPTMEVDAKWGSRVVQ